MDPVALFGAITSGVAAVASIPPALQSLGQLFRAGKAPPEAVAAIRALPEGTPFDVIEARIRPLIPAVGGDAVISGGSDNGGKAIVVGAQVSAGTGLHKGGEMILKGGDGGPHGRGGDLVIKGGVYKGGDGLGDVSVDCGAGRSGTRGGDISIDCGDDGAPVTIDCGDSAQR